MGLKNIRKLFIVTLIILFCIVIVFIAYNYYFLRAYDLKYNIKVYSNKDKQLFVSLNINNLNYKQRKELQLFKSDILMNKLNVEDGHGNKINYTDNNKVIDIKNIDSSSIKISYLAYLGNPEKHGHRDEIYNDMLTFDGSSVILFPSIVYSGDDIDLHRSINSVSVNIDKNSIANDNITSIMPIKGILTKPSWFDFLNLRMSSYTIGKFDKYTFKKRNTAFNVYVDKQNKNNLSNEDIKGLNSLYDYYVRLFRNPLKDFSLIILRNDVNDNQPVIGGVGSSNIASSFNPKDIREWQLMGHRMFHSFFDSNVMIKNLHFPPQLWFYEGLATYYENLSMNNLPEEIKNKVGVNVDKSFSELFKRYVYMRLKDPYLYTMAPMTEEKITSPGKIEFLHYTQAPLIIKTLEDEAYSKTKKKDNIIDYILVHKDGKDVDINNIINYLLKDDSKKFTENYLYDDQIVPLWYLSTNNENQDDIVRQLNDFEYTLWTWFRLEIKDFPQDKASIDKLDRLSEIALKENIHFASDDIEKNVNKLSPTVYKLLKVYALRAKVCNVDFLDPLLRFKLNEKGNLDKWTSYVSKIK